MTLRKISSSLTFAAMSISTLSTLHANGAVLFSSPHAFNSLQPRQTTSQTCPNDSFQSCQSVDANLPSGFCCLQKDSCYSLDNASTLLCCPAGGSCLQIATIECDIDLQNPHIHANSQILTQRINDSLPTCGSKCCPFGSSCTNDGQGCQINTSSAKFPSSTSSSSTSTSTSSSTTSTTPSSTNGIDSSKGDGKSGNNSKVALGVGIPLSLIAVAAGAGIIFWIWRKKLRGDPSSDSNNGGNSSRPTTSDSITRAKHNVHFRGRSADGHVLNVSDPIPQEQSVRTDFLLRSNPNSSELSRTSTLSRSIHRVRSFFGSSPSHVAPRSPPFTPTGGNWKMPNPPPGDPPPKLQHGSMIPLDPVAARHPPRHSYSPESPFQNPFSPESNYQSHADGFSPGSSSPEFSSDDDVRGHYVRPLTPNHRARSADNPYRPHLTREPSTESIRVYSPPDAHFRSASGGLNNSLAPNRYSSNGPNTRSLTHTPPPPMAQEPGARAHWPPRLFGEVPRPGSADAVREKPSFLGTDPYAGVGTGGGGGGGQGDRSTQMTTFTDMLVRAGLEKELGR